MQFKFNGGDGDQKYFSAPFLAERVVEPWFPSIIERGPAYLLKVKTGIHCGEYLAITSRMLASLEEQMSIRNYLSVVVHAVVDPGYGFIASSERLPAVGMAIIEVLSSARPSKFTKP